MKRNIGLAMILVCLISVACQTPTSETNADTGTISPATPRTQTATDGVTTETVDVGDIERSQAEGEGATEGTETTGTTTTP